MRCTCNRRSLLLSRLWLHWRYSLERSLVSSWYYYYFYYWGPNHQHYFSQQFFFLLFFLHATAHVLTNIVSKRFTLTATTSVTWPPCRADPQSKQWQDSLRLHEGVKVTRRIKMVSVQLQQTLFDIDFTSCCSVCGSLNCFGNIIQCSPLNSNSLGPTNFVIIMNLP